MTDAIDLRTDAVTQPTEAMWEAMRAATLGWAPAGEDASVERLEQAGAQVTGKEAGLFLPTGSMANLTVLLSAGERGDQIIAEASSHIIWSEEWAYAALAGLAARSIAGCGGVLPPDAVRAALRDRRFNHRPKTALVCLENTHNVAGGRVVSPEQTEAVAAVAHAEGARVHLDGSRIFNAAVALGVPVSRLTASVDTVALGLSKGLSAPGGALLCGSRNSIERARVSLRQIGGHSMPQAGLLAAAGLIALQEMPPRLADDHRRARALAGGLAAVRGIRVAIEAVETNIVMATIDRDLATAGAVAGRLETRNIRAYLLSDQTLRFVTHRHIDDAAVRQAVETVTEVIDELREETCSMS